MTGRATLHRAPLVAPIDGPVLQDGAVLCRNGRILAVGRFAELKGEAGILREHEESVLLPGLINAHAHLELSHLAALGREEPEPGLPITAWITALLRAREESPATDEEILEQARAALAGLAAGGTCLVADVGNRPESGTLAGGEIEVQFLWEMLGLSEAALPAARERLAAAGPEVRCTAHAPHSTAPDLIRHLKARAARRGHLFSLHVAESKEEIEFLRTGGGPFRSFLAGRGVGDSSFAPPGCGAVAYLDRLGVLDAGTLCVHCVQVEKREIELLAARGAKVCLCPGSNRRLAVGRAPAAELLAAGLLPALGTDSLASNPQLSLWREMRLLREDQPGLDPETVLAMATRGGAAALGADDRLGSLAPGKCAKVVAVRCGDLSPSEIEDFLTTIGEQAEASPCGGK